MSHTISGKLKFQSSQVFKTQAEWNAKRVGTASQLADVLPQPSQTKPTTPTCSTVVGQDARRLGWLLRTPGFMSRSKV